MSNPLFLQPYPSFSPDDCEALRQLVSRIIKPGCRILEVGSWLGTGSTRAIIEALLPTPDALLYCVDTWQGSPNVGRHQQIVQNYDVLATFRHNVELAGGTDRVKQQVMTSQAAETVADNSFDLVFIDGHGTVFSAIHPGVIVAVDEAFDGMAHLWAEHRLSRADGSKGYSTIWDIVK